MPEEVTPLVVLLEAIKMLGPAAIAAIVSIWVSRIQLQAKTTELQATARLRARELMFEAYQKHLEDVVEGSSKVANSCGKLLAILASESDEALRAQSREDVKRLLPTFKDMLVEDYAALGRDEELCKYEDLKKRYAEAQAEIGRVDVRIGDPEDGIRKLMKGYNVLGECEAELLKRMSKELFGEWL